MVDRCIVCGEIIPEGRQVCPKCENKPLPEKKHENPQKHAKNPSYGKRGIKFTAIFDKLIDFVAKK